MVVGLLLKFISVKLRGLNKSSSNQINLEAFVLAHEVFNVKNEHIAILKESIEILNKQVATLEALVGMK